MSTKIIYIDVSGLDFIHSAIAGICENCLAISARAGTVLDLKSGSTASQNSIKTYIAASAREACNKGSNNKSYRALNLKTKNHAVVAIAEQ